MGFSPLPPWPTHFRFEIAVNNLGSNQNSKAVENLANKNAHQICAQSAKSILLNKFVKVDRKHFKDDAQVVSENKSIFHPNDVVLIRRIVLIIKL